MAGCTERGDRIARRAECVHPAPRLGRGVPPAGILANSAGSFSIRRRSRRLMGPKEGAHVAHGQGNPIFGLLPRVEARFGLRRQTDGLQGHGQGMRWNILRQHQNWCLAVEHEITRHSKDEVRIGAIVVLPLGRRIALVRAGCCPLERELRARNFSIMRGLSRFACFSNP